MIRRQKSVSASCLCPVCVPVRGFLLPALGILPFIPSSHLRTFRQLRVPIWSADARRVFLFGSVPSVAPWFILPVYGVPFVLLVAIPSSFVFSPQAVPEGQDHDDQEGNAQRPDPTAAAASRRREIEHPLAALGAQGRILVEHGAAVAADDLLVVAVIVIAVIVIQIPSLGGVGIEVFVGHGRPYRMLVGGMSLESAPP